MLGALGVLRLSDSPGVESLSIPSEFSGAGSHARAWGWSHWKKNNKFGIFVFNLLPSEKMAWPPAAFFSAVWFKKITVFWDGG